MDERPDSFFTRIDEHTFQPTYLTSGAWKLDEQHISPLNGLTTHVVERWLAEQGAGDKAIARIGFDILGPVPLEPCTISVETVRPGRAVELVEATVTCRERSVLRARVWRIVRTDTSSVEGGAAEPLPAPDTVEPWAMDRIWPGGYIEALEVRVIRGPEPGRSIVWISTDAVLVPGEPVSELARYIGLVDTANGIAVRESPTEWLFPNVDLTIHLLRQPRGRWIGLDTRVVFGPDGQGITSTVLHDVHGQVGRAEQSLMVRPL